MTPAHRALGSGPPESLVSADAPGLLRGEDGRTGHGVRAWGVSAAFPSVTCRVPRHQGRAGRYSPRALALHSGPPPASGQGDGVPGRVTIYLKVVLPLTFV